MDRRTRLVRLFTEDFRAIDIASPLLSFDGDKDSSDVRKIMEVTDLDLVGLRVGGLVVGYAKRDDLKAGTCHEALRAFGDGQVLSEGASLRDALEVLDRHRHCFVATLGTVDALVRRSDVQKPQARMWLFGMITIIELNVTRAIEDRFAADSWKALLPAARVEKAEELHAERARRQQTSSLLDCLQFADKAHILFSDDELFSQTEFESRRAAKKAAKELQSLRNNLAHSQDIITYDWPAIARITGMLENVLARPG